MIFWKTVDTHSQSKCAGSTDFVGDGNRAAAVDIRRRRCHLLHFHGGTMGSAQSSFDHS